MTSTERLIRKLREAKSEEERKLIVEELRDYRRFLEHVYITCMQVLLAVSVGGGFVIMFATAYAALPVTLVLILSIIVATTVISLSLYTCRLEREIGRLREVVADPPMRSISRDIAIICGIVLTVSILFAVLVSLGII